MHEDLRGLQRFQLQRCDKSVVRRDLASIASSYDSNLRVEQPAPSIKTMLSTIVARRRSSSTNAANTAAATYKRRRSLRAQLSSSDLELAAVVVITLE